jgi:hypothetical protein
MKLNELEDADKIVTKEYLDAKLAKLELGISDRIIASERGQRMWIWGLYALVIISYFVRH